jgi:adenosine deaminase
MVVMGQYSNSCRREGVLESFIHHIPKAELHLHIEGTLEPELMFAIARRNGLSLPFNSVKDVRQAYRFIDLQSFLDIYYQGTRVLQQEQDFYDMTWAYLERAHTQNVRHAEIFFDPQAHIGRGVSFATVIRGIHRALEEGRRKMGLSTMLIMCFLRHLSAEEAMETLQEALPFKDWIVGVGLDSAEAGNPPEKFTAVFDQARQAGFLTVAHAGEEGPPEYIWQALEKLQVSRIDHGVRCLEDPRLVEELRGRQVPLTVCPISNVKLRIFDTMEGHNIRELMNAGLCVTVNSDDPAYFGGYITDNFLAVQQALCLDRTHIYKLVKNSFQACFLPQKDKGRLLQELEAFSRSG